MGEKWYDGLSDDTFHTEEDKKYKEAVEKIKDAVKSGMGFDDACASVNIEDAGLKKIIIDDALKVLIAEMHFAQKMPAEIVAEKLKIPVERVNAARDSMLEEVKETAVKAYNRGIPDN